MKSCSDQVVVDDALVVDEGPDPDPATAPPSVLGAFDQALHAAVDIGIARAALEDGAKFVTTKSRPWFEADVDSAADEPHVVRRFGELTARLYALEALLARGTALIDDALEPAGVDACGRRPGVAGRRGREGARAGVRSRDRQRHIRTGGGVGNRPGPYALDRHWRNVRVHSLHDPARWKYVHLGNYTLRATLPPRLGVLL